MPLWDDHAQWPAAHRVQFNDLSVRRFAEPKCKQSFAMEERAKGSGFVLANTLPDVVPALPGNVEIDNWDSGLFMAIYRPEHLPLTVQHQLAQSDTRQSEQRNIILSLAPEAMKQYDVILVMSIRVIR